MENESVSSDPDRLVLQAQYDADLLPAPMILGNIPDQEQKYHL